MKSTTESTWFSRLALFTLPAINLLYLAFLVFHYAIDAPDWDQWDFIPLLTKSYQGPITPADLWGQHNEHRLVFPRLIMLASAHLSGWNIRWELAINLLLGILIFCALVAQIRRTAQILNDAALRRLIPVVGLIAFSLRQHQNWVWGWQLQIFLNVLAVIVGIGFLTRQPVTWSRQGAAMLCGVVATYSFGNGLLFWFVGGLALAYGSFSKNKFLHLAAWSGVALLTIVSYLYHFVPSDSGAIPYALRHPGAVLYYICTYMGALPTFMTKEALSAAIGAAGMALFAGAALRLRRTGRVPLDVLLPYFCMAAYALMSAFISALGRVYLGSWQAMETRYITISALFWAALVLLLFLASQQSPSQQSQGETVPPRSSKRQQTILAVVILLIAFSSLKETHKFKDRYVRLLPWQQAMQRGETTLPGLYPRPQVSKEGVEALRKYHLNVFRDGIQN